MSVMAFADDLGLFMEHSTSTKDWNRRNKSMND